MTGEPQTPPGERSAHQFTEPLRELVALVLVGATTVFLLVALIRLVPATGLVDSFAERSAAGFYNFVNLATIALPILAVLLVTHLGPATGRARLITTVALAQYAVAAFFGLLFGFFVGLIRAAELSFRFAFEEFLAKLAWLAVLGVVGYVVYQVWRGVFQPAKPSPSYQPYGGTQYGQPQQPPPGWGGQQPPQGWGGQQPPPGQPQGQWGQPHPGRPPQDQPIPPGQWSEPTQVQPPGQWGRPQSAPPAPPQSAPPAPNGPYPPAGPYQPPQAQPYGYGQPPPGSGAPGGAFNEPTEMYGRHPYGDERGPEDPNARD